MVQAESMGFVAASGDVPTRVSGFDRLNAGLVAVLLVVAGLDLLFTGMWLAADKTPVHGRGTVFLTPALNLSDSANPMEIELLDPVATGLPMGSQASLLDSLRAVTEAISTIEARPEQSQGSGLEPGNGRRGGFPDGIPGIPGNRIGSAWMVEFEATSFNAYAEMLETLGLEVAAMETQSDRIDCLALDGNKAALQPSSRREVRLRKMAFLTHQNQRLEAWDRELLRSAGRQSFTSCIVGQLYPPFVLQELHRLELEYAELHGLIPDEVRRTVFRVVGQPGNYRFEVAFQERRR